MEIYPHTFHKCLCALILCSHSHPKSFPKRFLFSSMSMWRLPKKHLNLYVAFGHIHWRFRFYNVASLSHRQILPKVAIEWQKEEPRILWHNANPKSWKILLEFYTFTFFGHMDKHFQWWCHDPWHSSKLSSCLHHYILNFRKQVYNQSTAARIESKFGFWLRQDFIKRQQHWRPNLRHNFPWIWPETRFLFMSNQYLMWLLGN